MKEAKEFVDFVSEFLKELIAASSFNDVQILQTQAKDHYEMCKTQFTTLPPSS